MHLAGRMRFPQSSVVVARMSVWLAWAGVCLVTGPVAQGQNTSNVFSPDVSAGNQAVEWRFTYDPEGDQYATRLHYQYAFNDALRMRGIVLYEGAADGDDFDYQYFRWETQWQFVEDQDHGWDSALRFEVQLADGDDPPSRVRLAWSSKFDLADDWQYRFIFITGREIGARSGEGLLLETRTRLRYTLTDQLDLALDLYSDFNDTRRVGGFAEQEHQLGPLLQWEIADGIELNAGVLIGISEAAADTEWRTHLIFDF